ncbi:hypothetical protein LBMAG42_01650 [Deltaproteobacteria bacterium]|nr:hypothetical protein LBMAG42_01650 [Deltaproteobacteria bacterium]
MADLTLPAQADALHDRYRRGFVGRSRATRDLAALDAIISETNQLLGSLGTSAALRAQTEERLKLYRDEREAIGTIQAGGPEAITAWRLAEWSEASFLRYGREFGGQPRPTRDLGLLAELHADQARWAAEAGALSAKLNEARLAAQIVQMEANLKLYAAEAVEIAAARKRSAPADLGSVLAACANRQFALYRLHFEGRPRVSRRPALLRRIAGTLEAIRAEMEAARAAGLTIQANTDNIAKVAERIRHHGDELAKIKAAYTNTATPQLVAGLGDEANTWIARYRNEYAGKPREGRDLAPLADICEGLHEVARAIDEVIRERGAIGTPADKNLTIVLDHLKIAEREFVAIRNLKRSKKAAN